MDAEGRVLTIDDAGQRKWEKVEYISTDVKGEVVYITREGLQYIRDALRRKHQFALLKRLDDLPRVLSHPDVVIWDPDREVQDTLLYYRRLYFPSAGRHVLVCAVVKVRGGIRFLYNFFVQQSGKVKGHGITPALVTCIWYIHPRRRPKEFGIKG